ncbi:thiosulfate sulfurtransferase [Endozoicomonas montiporae]|uniref:Sulfurtransferase n=2 Tax=Endozoicomonas montiporae TaxID=1027273 RepID=A0A081N2H1_9GAMM|nr:rhodanese-like domain-containing protein [Endozoicomonas montiporae]AMO58389.1 thiosulfate sulfurtransferase [Endozoicomonas montiporae CL-33]KEQ12644.1 thiosulfate sulfurtransferase [Endozoicomonas montiporae]
MNKKTLAAGVLAAAAVVAMPVYRAIFGVEAVNVNATEQALKIAEYANADAFITPEALQQLMESDEDVVVIGSLNPVRGNRPIQGSFTVWRSDYSASGDAYPFGGMRTEQDEMEQLLSGFGATTESTVVVYAADAHHDAARLYWQVKMLGHEDVRYLDGGLNAWVGADLPTGNGNPTVEATDYQAPNYSEAELATFDMVVNATSDSDWVIIDTRGLGEHDGSQTLSGAFGPGAIPASQFLEWTTALNEDTTLKSADELKAIYGDLIEGKKVISYCQSGVRSAHTTMVLKEVLGAEEVYNYDGSWIEWSHAHYEAEQEGAAVINAGS